MKHFLKVIDLIRKKVILLSIMEKLVLTITDTDDQTYSFDDYICFTYESKEKAILDLGSVILKKIEDLNNDKKNDELIYEKSGRLLQFLTKNKKENEDIYNNVQELQLKLSKTNKDFSFAGKIISINYFYKNGIIETPVIQTLNEWFESKVINIRN